MCGFTLWVRNPRDSPPRMNRPITTTSDQPSIDSPGRLGDAALGFLAAIVVSGLAASVVLAIDPDLADGATGLVVSSLALWVGFAGAPIVVSRTRGSGRLSQDFGLRATWRDACVGLPLGVATQVLVLPGLYFLIGLVFDTSELSKPAEETIGRGSGLGLVAVLLVVGIGAPIAEELFFRGLFQRAAQSRFGAWQGWLLVAAVFGASHFQVLQFPGLFVAGLLFGGLAWRSGRLGPAIFAHIGFNTVAAVLLIW